MAVNFKLRVRPPLDPAKDSMGRSWVGWDPRRSDEELWENNRGVWNLRDSVTVEESVATLSFDGVIRVVARITGSERVTHPSFSKGFKTALVGEVLVAGDPLRDALVGAAVDHDRNPVTYFDTTDVEQLAAGETPRELGGRTYLLTHNPDRWSWDPADRAADVADTAAGVVVRGRWSTGNRVHDMDPGDRVFLLQQGGGIRGVVASGHLSSSVFQDAHWDNSGNEANYALVEWDVVLEPEDALPTEDLIALIPSYSWAPQSSGVMLPEPAASELEALWASHTHRPTPKPNQVLGGGLAWQLDPVRRKQAEDHGQALLVKHYRDQGWKVEDRRIGHPYDAVATKGTKTLYLEAKGTQTTGGHVLVSPGEVAWARAHECVIGIVSGIRFDPDGNLDMTSGTLRVYDWSADEDELTPTQYEWTPTTLPIA